LAPWQIKQILNTDKEIPATIEPRMLLKDSEHKVLILFMILANGKKLRIYAF
jgi:hypothetical protein